MPSPNGPSKGQSSTRNRRPRKKAVYRTADPTPANSHKQPKPDTLPDDTIAVKLSKPLTRSDVLHLLNSSPAPSSNNSPTSYYSRSSSSASASSHHTPPTVTKASPATFAPIAKVPITSPHPDTNPPPLTATHYPSAPTPKPSTSTPHTRHEETSPFDVLQRYHSDTDNDGFTLVKAKRATPQRTITQRTPAPTPTNNSFAALTKDTTKDLPPPIILNGKDYKGSHVTQHLKHHNITNFSIQANKTTTRILPKDDNTHTAIIKLFQHPKNKVEFHTFAPRGTKRNQTFLILGLDKIFPIESVEDALRCDEFVSARRVTKTDKDGIKRYIEPIQVTFTPDYNPKEHLYKINDIDHIKIRVKRDDPVEQIPQCYRCQEYGHTKGYCTRPRKCVRCAGPHEARHCIQKENALKCANCTGSHPASWRGCSHHQEILRKIQARKNPTTTPQYLPAPQPKHNPWAARQPSANTHFTPNPQPISVTLPLPTPAPPTASNPPLIPQPPIDPYAAPPWIADLKEMMANLMDIVKTLLNHIMSSKTK